MVKFKIKNKKTQKFISIFFGPEKLYKIRYKLGIWNNSAHDESLKKIYDLIKKDKNLELQFKFNNKFVLANDDNVKEFMKTLTHNKTKKKGGKTKIKTKKRR